MLPVIEDYEQAVTDYAKSLEDSLGAAPLTLDDLAAYADTAWQTVQYFYEPRLALLVGALAFLFLLARLYLGGFFGWIFRVAGYNGLVYLIVVNEQFRALFPDPLSATFIAVILVIGFWLPVTLLGWLLRIGRGRAAPDRHVAPGSAAAGGNEAFNVQRQGKEQKQVIVIMMTDIVGYSARMEKDETATYALLKEHNIIMRKAITTNRGREIKTIGDAFMVVFAAPIDALRCAIAMQKGLYAFNKPRAVNDHLRVRIGLYQGEAVVTEKDVFGEAVNIAARMESITDPGGISVSAEIYEAVKGKVDVGFQSVGTPKMKNIAKPPEVYRVHVAHA